MEIVQVLIDESSDTLLAKGRHNALPLWSVCAEIVNVFSSVALHYLSAFGITFSSYSKFIASWKTTAFGSGYVQLALPEKWHKLPA